jgi:uncharacterized membrane-anchored protein YitT (DUF2179 family)
MDKTRAYIAEEVLALTLVIEQIENSESSFKWLMENNCIELAALCDVLIFGKTTAKKWLEENDYVSLSTFLDAMEEDEGDDDDTIQALLKGEHREWAAVASMINDGDDNAEAWLIKSGLNHYAAFADTLSKKINDVNDRKALVEGSVAIAAVAAGGLLGGIAGAGIVGFGGGSFGGAGALALW